MGFVTAMVAPVPSANRTKAPYVPHSPLGKITPVGAVAKVSTKASNGAKEVT